MPDHNCPDRLARTLVSLRSTEIAAPIRRRMSMIPVRLGLRPTPSITISEPESDAAATIQNAADEMSPGTASCCAVRR